MHPNVTSKEKLLLAAKELAKTEGLSALQMRSLASAAGVAVGSVYNYFPNKNALLTAVVASIWKKTPETWAFVMLFPICFLRYRKALPPIRTSLPLIG